MDKFDGEVFWWRFIDFWYLFLLIFWIICGEWIEFLWDCMRVVGFVFIIFFILVFFLGYFIVSKLNMVRLYVFMCNEDMLLCKWK